MHTAPCAACCCLLSEVTTQTLGHPSSFKAATCNNIGQKKRERTKLHMTMGNKYKHKIYNKNFFYYILLVSYMHLVGLEPMILPFTLLLQCWRNHLS